MIFLMFSAMVINLSCFYIIMLIFDKLETEKKKNPNKKTSYIVDYMIISILLTVCLLVDYSSLLYAFKHSV